MVYRKRGYRKKSFRRRSYRTKRRSYKKKRYNKRRRLSFIKKPELKYASFIGNYPWGGSNAGDVAITTGGKFIELQDLVQPGTGAMQRIGNKIIITSVKVLGRLSQGHYDAVNNILPSLNDAYNDVSMAILTSDVPEPSVPNATGVNSVAFTDWWPQDWQYLNFAFDKASLKNQQVTKVIAHKHWHLDGKSNVAYGTTAGFTGFYNFTSDPAYRNLHFFKKLNLPVEWNVNSMRCVKNRLFLGFISDSGTAPHPHIDALTFYVKITYYDV